MLENVLQCLHYKCAVNY